MIDIVAKAKNCFYDSNIDKDKFKSCNRILVLYF